MLRNGFVIIDMIKSKITFYDGYLGSWNDEERSEMR